ncbi:hypothetical protein [Opitutus sp. ER46]|nr:hypothetical protein [Opitutus sp. ER46]
MSNVPSNAAEKLILNLRDVTRDRRRPPTRRAQRNRLRRGR